MSKLLLDKEEKVISIKMQLPGVYVEILGTLSIDNEMHDDGVRNPRRTGSRVSFSAGKTKVKLSVVLRRRRFLVLCLVALIIAFKNVRNLLLINHMKEVLQIPDTITYSQRSVCDGLEGLCMLLKRLSYPCRNGDMIHSLCREIRSAYRSLTALAVTRNSGLFREFK